MFSQFSAHQRNRFPTCAHECDDVMRPQWCLFISFCIREKSIRLDVSLDQLSFTRYMTEIPLLSSSRSPNADLIELIDIFSDENATAEELQMANVIACKYEGNEQENFEIPAVKFKDEEQEEAFYDQINSALTELEGFLKTKQINSFDQIASDLPLKYIKVNISGESQRKCAFYLQDNNEKHCVDVYMKNFFETHGKKKIHVLR